MYRLPLPLETYLLSRKLLYGFVISLRCQATERDPPNLSITLFLVNPNRYPQLSLFKVSNINMNLVYRAGPGALLIMPTD
jgi:hypothetical protein